MTTPDPVEAAFAALVAASRTDHAEKLAAFLQATEPDTSEGH